jgi:hypothetical protein
LHLFAGTNNQIVSNFISDSGTDLFIRGGSQSNSFSNNTLTNSFIGLLLGDPENRYGNCNDNLFYNNNFMDNTQQVFIYQSTSTWDNGQVPGGNYWKNYNGTDANNDGRGDYPFVLDSNNTDHYPLMSPFNNSTSTPIPTPTPTTQPTPTPMPTATSSPTPSPPSPTPTPTPPSQNTSKLQLFCFSSSTQSSFRVEITGNLTYAGAGLQNQNIELQISKDFGQSWTALTSVITGENGKFDAVWMPTVTGNYLLQAIFTGNQNIPSTNIIINCAVSSLESQNNFLVSSNSTLSSLSFDSTTKTLSFSVSGPTGTNGSITVSIQKSLIANTSGLTVYLDGAELPYAIDSQQDAWLISFSYHHSSHQVEIKMNQQPSTQSNPLLQITPEVLMILGVIILALLISVTAAYFSFRKNRTKPESPK